MKDYIFTGKTHKPEIAALGGHGIQTEINQSKNTPGLLYETKVNTMALHSACKH